MKLIETSVSGKTVRMRLADDADPAKAKEWVEFALQIENIAPPAVPPLLAEIQLLALRRLRDVMSEESKGLAALASQRTE